MSKISAPIAFDNSFAREMEGFYVPQQGAKAPKPELLLLNTSLVSEMGLDEDYLSGPKGAEILTGSLAPEGGSPLAQAYAGHQFGGFSPQLGDGRALLIGEVIDCEGRRRDIHLKGSGPTPFSRGGDGKAVLGPVLREYLIGEAMHALGVPTTRALAASLTGEQVHREGWKPGAVLARVASSHIRVGTFQFFAARGDVRKLQQLADYAIDRHFGGFEGSGNRYLSLLSAVVERQAKLVARWMHLGFIHGVMNTDNMTISGETIDYGPCAFMDAYDEGAVFSSIDHHGRYAYGNQPAIAKWNLARLAETLLFLVHPDEQMAIKLATREVNAFDEIYQQAWLSGMRKKIGILNSQQDEDSGLVGELMQVLQAGKIDFTQFFRALSRASIGEIEPVLQLVTRRRGLETWLAKWQHRLVLDDDPGGKRAERMDQVNPIYIPRNHLVEAALTAAEEEGDLGLFHQLLAVLQDPYRQKEELAAYEAPAPADFGAYRTFCGT